MVDALISSLIIIMIFIVASMFLCFEECSGEIDWDKLLRKIKKTTV